ncbi:hypothetical protein LUZ60_002605 [Juncus effusus]|nr:hypothetical protein LUZ60_002605 [Juncus effusus]
MPLTLSAAISTSTTLSADPPSISAASIAKSLASPNQAIRNKTFRNLSTLLPSLSPLPQSALLKIWKGLFYCYWHSDKPLYQSNLATSIAALVSTNGVDLATSFLDAGMVTLRREWGSIDFLRMDKFYLLVRRISKHTFLLLKSNQWDLNLVMKIVGIFEERALGEEGTRGFSFHFVEIFLEELNGFLPVKKGVLEVLICPFLTVLEKSNDSVLVNKVKVNIFDKFLVNGAKHLSLKKSGGEIEKGSEVDLFGIIGLIMGFSEKLLDLAKKEETVQANKDVLHDLRDGFFKLEKDLKKSGLEIQIEICDGIEICENVKSENNEGFNEKVQKKRKKDKKELGEKKAKKNHEKVKQEDLEEKKEKKNSEKKNKNKKIKTQEENNNTIKSEENTNGTESSNKKEEKEPDTETLISFDETLMSNLQKQFEIAAKESGLSTVPSISTPKPSKTQNPKPSISTPKPSKKRKSSKTPSKPPQLDTSSKTPTGDEPTTGVKKVRFSIKDNIVWKPSTPMPPVSVRIPPGVAPRGSALKKGVPAGPIRTEMESPIVKRRRVKKAKSVGKSPSLAKLRKMQNMSA